MEKSPPLDPLKLYRLPWSLTDNVISWLEPTKKCNIYCEGCYSANNPAGHKTLEEVRRDLDVFLKYRTTDAVSIAGGDPLTHPQIVEVVRMVAQRGLKPVVNTNGVALTPELLRELKAAGARGFTFHVDSLQRRPGWTGKTETELNALRLQFAEMLASEGGLSCAFNATVYESTLPCVPDLLEWARRHIDKVHVMVFIAFRFADSRFDYFAGDRKVDVGNLVYGKDRRQRTDISSREVVEEARRRHPDFSPCAYLGGTEDPAAFKWLLTLRVGTPEGILGYAGPKFIELAQVLNHLFRGRYLGYVPPSFHRSAKAMLAAGLFDGGLRRLAWSYLKKCLANPLRLFKPLHLQSVMVIQPVDLLKDGRQSMCDGCPDMTVHNGELVWSCRLEERLKHGQFLRMVPRLEEPVCPKSS